MSFYSKHMLMSFATLVLIMQLTKGQDKAPAGSEEEDDSFIEEPVENFNESRNRRRRSLETSVEEGGANEGQAKAATLHGLPAIPGLPDPETIMKIADILTTVGQQVLPIFVSGNAGISDFVRNRATHDMKFLNKFKNELEVLNEQLKMKK